MVPGYALQRVSYGDLVGGQHFHHKVEWNKQYGNPLAIKVAAKPKDPSQYKVVGKSFPQKVITERSWGAPSTSPTSGSKAWCMRGSSVRPMPAASRRP